MLENGRRIGVLWDMDGVIVDSGDAHFLSWQKALKRYDLPCTRSFFDETFGMNNRGIISLLLQREATDAEVDAIGGLKEELFREDVKGKLAPLPGVIDWLSRFKRASFPQAVASSAPQENIDAIVDGLGLRTAFQALVSGSALPGKPDPSTFLLAAERLGLAPDDCLVIEDAKVGVQAAKSAGMRCLAVCTTHQAGELAHADLVIKGLDDLTPADVTTLFS
jgi:beta-phosphoglucomutase